MAQPGSFSVYLAGRSYAVSYTHLGLGGQPYQADLLVQDGRIAQIAPGITEPADQVIDATGVGKALLADYQLPQLKALYYDGLYPLTEHTITDFRLLADQLAEIDVYKRQY